MTATIQELMSFGFQHAFITAMAEKGTKSEAIHDAYLRSYANTWKEIPLAPSPQALEPTEDNIIAIENLDLRRQMEPGHTWPDIVARARTTTKDERNNLNPYAPNWFAKTETSQNPFTNENRGMDSLGRAAVTTWCVKCSPSGAGVEPKKLFTVSPISDTEFLEEIATAAAKLRALFLRSLGPGDAETKDHLFKWGPCFVPLAGLGTPFFRKFASKIQEFDDWQHWAVASDEELYDDILEARTKTGFPAGLLWAPFTDLHRSIKNQSMADPQAAGQIVMPFWYPMTVGMHILKHVRFWPDYNGKPYISVMFGGTRVFRSLDPEQAHSSLVAACNKMLASEICHTLHIPYNGGTRGREWYHDGVQNALQYIQLEHLPRARELRSRIHIIPPPAVTTTVRYAHMLNTEWVRPGFNVDGVSGFDLNTGRVENDIEVSATDVVALKWPFAINRPEDTLRFRSMLPEVVLPEPASAVVLRSIKNLNDLGERTGLSILIDTVITADLLRIELLGSAIGNNLPREFPLVFVLPTGATEEETTNQGKTTAAMVFGSILEPRIDVHIFSPVSSAPAQRSMSMPIEQLGTTILDEYSLPRTPDHFLSQAGLQALATGGIVHPGRAQENCPGVRLSHPLFFTAKFAPKIPDIINRMLPLFLDQLTPATRLDDNALSTLMSGKLGILARLSHLLWLKKTGLLQLLRMASLASGEWRFNGHMGVANVLAMFHGGALSDVNRYLVAAREAAATQQEKAEQSGLTDSVLGAQGFDPKWYWDGASVHTLHGLELMCKHKGCLHVTETVRHLVEDGETRSFSSEVARCQTNEKGAAMKLAKALKAHPYVRQDGWTLERVAMDGNTRNAYLRIVRSVPPPVPPPVPPAPPPVLPPVPKL